MSTLSTINIKHPSSASNNLVLDSSGNATTANNATVSGNITVTGTGSVGGNFSFNSGYGSAAVAYGCRAWVNFNGTGTVAIRASGNVSSITDNGTGDYTVNFTTAMPDRNYAVAQSSGRNDTGYTVAGSSTTPTTTAYRVTTYNGSYSSLQDGSEVYVAIFR